MPGEDVEGKLDASGKKWSMEALRSGSDVASGRDFPKCRGVGLLTKVCKRPQPRSAVLHNCPLLNGMVVQHVRTSGQGAVGSPETRR